MKKKKPIGEITKMIKTCTYCKKEFEAKRIDKHFCSASCRQLNHLQRKAVVLFGNVPNEVGNVKTDEQNVKTYPVKIEEKITEKQVDKVENEFKQVSSKFIKDIISLLKRRSIEEDLHSFIRNNKQHFKSIAWVNVRLRCLIEVLLLVSERKQLPLIDLIEITNAFICLVKSEHFKKLPANFLYYNIAKDLRDKLKVICIENEGAQELPLKLNRRLKIELIVYRCELRVVASK
ncbi:MAG: hypothetical protein IPJ32_10560 [Sphingobacteriaceae bacterium]|nr:hypothetical protein [Sphingobacteriaceae bacterium]